MTPDNLILAALAAFVAWRIYGVWNARRRIPEYLARGAQVVDVRSAAEFAAGHASGSVNVPLPEIDRRAGELDRSRPVIACCASGTRSAMAARRLKRLGFADVLNGGSWRNLPPGSG